MSLLHATWLETLDETVNFNCPALFLWVDTWTIKKENINNFQTANHPSTFSSQQLRTWLNKKNLLKDSMIDATASITLPSQTLYKKKNQLKSDDLKELSIIPLQAGEAITEKCECWPWKIEGLALTALEASRWLTKLPLSSKDSDFGDEILWWTHLQRWSLKIIAEGLWLPEIKCSQHKKSPYQGRWTPLLTQENERKRLEQFAKTMPLVTSSAVAWIKKNDNKQSLDGKNPLASFRPKHNRLQVINVLTDIVDAQLRVDFHPQNNNLDPLLTAWQKALGSNDALLILSNEDSERLAKTSTNWKGTFSSHIQPAKTCLKLNAPINDENDWLLEFFLQAEADPEILIPAKTIWEKESTPIEIGHIIIEQPSVLLLEGLGRTLNIFPAIEKGLETATPIASKLSPAEAFVLIKKTSHQLRDIGISVILPKSLSKGLASRLGISINAELQANSTGTFLGENLDWNWELMIGGMTLSMKEFTSLTKKNSPLVNHKGTWVELRSQDLKNAERFFLNPPSLKLDDALSLTAIQGNTLFTLPVHLIQSGPRLKKVLEKYHHHKEADALPAPKGFQGELRPYQERGLGWLAFLYRFDQGACLADDMGLGKTIQVLAFIQYLKINNELKKPILLIAPTSVLTNWKRETLTFTPQISLMEHYGSKRCSNKEELKTSIKNIDIFLTSYGLVYKDSELLKEIDWQGIIIDEAQAIKNPQSKQSLKLRELSKNLKNNPLRIALTGTPIENRINEIWSLMNFLNPKVLGEESFFNQRYKLPIEHYADISSLKDLKARISPFILRRSKTDKSVISDLPEKVQINEWIILSEEQKKLYNKTVEKALNEIQSLPVGKRQGRSLALLIRLKQICNHPALILKETNISKDFLERSNKVQRLDEILDQIIESNDRALIFTQFVEWGYLLQTYLEKKWDFKIPFLNGSTSKVNRQNMIDSFQKDPRGPKIFILSLKAGGLGLNLTRANHVIHIDRWWNPAVENQATDRAYRIGQKKTVIVHKFISLGSLEEKINQMLKSKSTLAEDILSTGDNWIGKLHIEKLKELVKLEQTDSDFQQ